jgi:hypothetical protein
MDLVFYPVSVQQEDWQWRVPFKTKSVKLGEELSKETIFTGLKEGEELEEPAVRSEEYYRSRPCVRACRRAAETAEQFVLDKE